MVFGFSVALVYGGPKDLLCVVLGFPVVLVLALAEVNDLCDLSCKLLKSFAVLDDAQLRDDCSC